MCVKGKGIQITYWLVGKEGYARKLPDFEDMGKQTDLNRPSIM